MIKRQEHVFFFFFGEAGRLANLFYWWKIKYIKLINVWRNRFQQNWIGKDNLALLAKACAKEHVINSGYLGLNCNWHMVKKDIWTWMVLFLIIQEMIKKGRPKMQNFWRERAFSWKNWGWICPNLLLFLSFFLRIFFPFKSQIIYRHTTVIDGQ